MAKAALKTENHSVAKKIREAEGSLVTPKGMKTLAKAMERAKIRSDELRKEFRIKEFQWHKPVTR